MQRPKRPQQEGGTSKNVSTRKAQDQAPPPPPSPGVRRGTVQRDRGRVPMPVSPRFRPGVKRQKSLSTSDESEEAGASESRASHESMKSADEQGNLESSDDAPKLHEPHSPPDSPPEMDELPGDNSCDSDDENMTLAEQQALLRTETGISRSLKSKTPCSESSSSGKPAVKKAKTGPPPKKTKRVPPKPKPKQKKEVMDLTEGKEETKVVALEEQQAEDQVPAEEMEQAAGDAQELLQDPAEEPNQENKKEVPKKVTEVSEEPLQISEGQIQKPSEDKPEMISDLQVLQAEPDVSIEPIIIQKALDDKPEKIIEPIIIQQASGDEHAKKPKVIVIQEADEKPKDTQQASEIKPEQNLHFQQACEDEPEKVVDSIVIQQAENNAQQISEPIQQASDELKLIPDKTLQQTGIESHEITEEKQQQVTVEELQQPFKEPGSFYVEDTMHIQFGDTQTLEVEPKEVLADASTLLPPASMEKKEVFALEEQAEDQVPGEEMEQAAGAAQKPLQDPAEEPGQAPSEEPKEVMADQIKESE